ASRADHRTASLAHAASIRGTTRGRKHTRAEVPMRCAMHDALPRTHGESAVSLARTAASPGIAPGVRAFTHGAARAAYPGYAPWRPHRVRTRVPCARVLAACVPVLDHRARGRARVGGMAPGRPDRVSRRTGVVVAVAARATLADRHARDPAADVADAG